MLLISNQAFAQIRLGLFESGNNTVFSGDTPVKAGYGSDLGFGFGAAFDYHFSYDIVLNVKAGYTAKSTLLQYSVDYQYEKFDSIRINIDYLEIPIAVKVIANNYFTYVTAGISINFPVHASIKDLRKGEKNNVEENFNDLSLSADFGIGIQFHIGSPIMFIEARYSQGLTNLNDEVLGDYPIQGKIKSNSMYLMAGLLYTL
jgi:hypothetical protein